MEIYHIRLGIEKGSAMPYINKTGLPSVTNILKPWIDTRWFTKESCDRGSYAHDRVEFHLKREFMVDYEEQWEVYFKSFQKFEPRIKKVVLVEERLADEDLGYCGQPDLVFIDEDGVLTLCDWKTAQGIMKYWPLQLGGYSMLLKSQKDIHVGKNIIVRLRNEAAKNPLIGVYSVQECERLFTNQLELFKMLWGNSWKNK